MTQKHLVLLAMIGLALLHVISDGEYTVKLLKQWK